MDPNFCFSISALSVQLILSVILVPNDLFIIISFFMLFFLKFLIGG